MSLLTTYRKFSHGLFEEPIIEPIKSKIEKNDMTSFSAVGSPICMKSRRLVQNDMPTALIWSKPQPEVELQYGGRLFFETGNSYTSAVD